MVAARYGSMTGRRLRVLVPRSSWRQVVLVEMKYHPLEHVGRYRFVTRLISLLSRYPRSDQSGPSRTGRLVTPAVYDGLGLGHGRRE